jgi:hypothetical protein
MVCACRAGHVLLLALVHFRRLQEVFAPVGRAMVVPSAVDGHSILSAFQFEHDTAWKSIAQQVSQRADNRERATGHEPAQHVKYMKGVDFTSST